MRLQHQVLLFIILTSLVAMVLSYTLIKNSIDSDFSKFENSQILEGVNRLNNSLSYDIKQIERQTADWSIWDDSYHFIENRNNEYIASNLNVETFQNIEVDYFAYLNSNIEIVYANKLTDSGDAFEELSTIEINEITELAKYHIDSNKQKNSVKPTSSLIQLGSKLCLFSFQTIQKTDGTGERNHAFLLFASVVNDHYIKQLSTITQSNVTIEDKLTPSSSMKIIDNDLIKGLLTLKDYSRQPLITLSVTSPRTIHLYGQSITNKFMIILPVIFFLIGLLAHVIMNILVVNRIAKLRKHIQNFTRSPSDTKSFDVKSKSEISDLATDFNTLFETINNTQEELNRALNIAHNATQAKTDFLANMSHEIRTPMTAILGYNNLLKTDATDKEKASYINTIEKNGEQLLCIINEILDISKIEANELSINIQQTELSPVLQEVCSLMQLSAIDKGLQFNVESLTDIPEWIDTDASRLKQVLVNLIGNAIKFTPKGSITIIIEHCNNTKTLKISVKDTGIGLDKQSLENIFKPFYQVESSMTRKFQGTGLGLTIAKDLTEKLGGELSITSQPDKGTTFSITLPTNQAASLINVNQQPYTSEALQFSPTKKLHGDIFIIDDNPVILILIAKMLSNFGLTAHCEAESKVALSKLLDGEHKADIVFMDMQMPIIDGYSATQYLITNGFKKPIVAITANTMEGDKEKCLLAGCSEFLSKPIDPEKLYETCERFL